jgi:signal transduction histidine kinase
MPCEWTNHAELRRLNNFVQTAGFFCALLLATFALAAEPSTGRIFTPVAANNNLPVLTKVVQVRELSPQEASRGYPVRVVGVLTYCDPPSYKQFVQDDSEGIYVDFNGNQTSDVLHPGQEVEIVGFSGPGDYAPVIHAKQTRVLGVGKFPTAKPTTIQILMTGAEDSQWVVLRGVIRDQAVATNETVLVLATGEATMQLKLPSAAGMPAPTNLVDAAVEVRGVCSTLFNERRRLRGVELQVPGWEQVEVREPAPTEPFELPPRAISDLFEFHPGNSGLHRARVRGSVILRLGDGTFFLQDGSGGIQVQTAQTAPSARVGRTLQVVGFPAVSDKLPMLKDAQVRPTPAGAVVAPLRLDAKSPPSVDWHATLVRLEGRVIGHSIRSTEELLTVQFGQRVIDAILEKGVGPDQLTQFISGSVVEMCGVYVARLDEGRQAQSFQLRLRSAADVVVLASPSWWSARHTLWVLGGVVTVLLLALGWVRSLQKQVQQRTGQLQEEIEERKRAEKQLKEAQGEVVRASRAAGMGEVATSVLHNVGNVLNSVNVSADLVTDRLKASKLGNIGRVAALLREHQGNLAAFITQDARGCQLPAYFQQLAEHLDQEQSALMGELESLKKNIDHIKEIVAVQQTYARVAGVTETVQIRELVEDALRMHAGALNRHEVEICREYAPNLPMLTLDRHKVLQILVNLVHNAKYACEESGRKDKRLTVHIFNGNGRLKIAVRDNGVGILQENLTRIFQHGFTTRKDGHGFGLHSGALAAIELGGALIAQSDGPGQGAIFTLELPCTSAPGTTASLPAQP